MVEPFLTRSPSESNPCGSGESLDLTENVPPVADPKMAEFASPSPPDVLSAKLMKTFGKQDDAHVCVYIANTALLGIEDFSLRQTSLDEVGEMTLILPHFQ